MTPAMILMDFFYFYFREFDPETQAIDVQTGDFIAKQEAVKIIQDQVINKGPNI